ncbi:hypothetical protein K431DRAFT_102412 [Polychaeton citri CBS 116435]|uniref:Uncharacterized protein n=1 Tax=Polychaeton citri CBS 116435 TaxID=1314669 RepID=A0A9P4UMV2_9PEZI|nr:hypothetical protein K431DRAFT_102412 [Polychaeton citri CBS 116435]
MYLLLKSLLCGYIARDACLWQHRHLHPIHEYPKRAGSWIFCALLQTSHFLLRSREISTLLSIALGTSQVVSIWHSRQSYRLADSQPSDVSKCEVWSGVPGWVSSHRSLHRFQTSLSPDQLPVGLTTKCHGGFLRKTNHLADLAIWHWDVVQHCLLNGFGEGHDTHRRA